MQIYCMMQAGRCSMTGAYRLKSLPMSHKIRMGQETLSPPPNVFLLKSDTPRKREKKRAENETEEFPPVDLTDTELCVHIYRVWPGLRNEVGSSRSWLVLANRCLGSGELTRALLSS